MQTILNNCRLFDGYNPDLTNRASVVINDGYIVDVIRSNLYLHETSFNVINLDGYTLMPGLIDSHVHLVYSASKDPSKEFHNEKDSSLNERIIKNSQMALKAGITTLRDCGGWNNEVQNVRDKINQGEIVGPRILSSGTAITTPNGHLRDMGVLVSGSKSIMAAINELKESNVDFIKVMASGGNSDGDATQPQFSKEELRLLTEKAHSYNLQVAAHLHSSIGIRRALKAGVNTFEHCSWLALRQPGEKVFRLDYDLSVVKKMVDQGVAVCPATGHNFRMNPDAGLWYEDKNDLLRSFIEIRSKTTQWMHEAGVSIIVGTDAGCSLTKFEDFSEVFPIFIEKFSFQPVEAILAATGIAAKVLKISDTIGTIEKGKIADLVVINGDPFKNIKAMKQIEKVFLGGKLVVDAGELINEKTF